MKSIFILAAFVLLCGHKTADDNLKTEETAKELFAKTFPNVSNAKWYNEKGNMLCQFSEGSTRFSLLYNEEGNLVQSVRYYGKEFLPPILLTNVIKRYPSAVLNGVTEISTAFNVDIYVHLDNATEFITLKADPYGVLSVHSRMKKAK